MANLHHFIYHHLFFSILPWNTCSNHHLNCNFINDGWVECQRQIVCPADARNHQNIRQGRIDRGFKDQPTGQDGIWRIFAEANQWMHPQRWRVANGIRKNDIDGFQIPATCLVLYDDSDPVVHTVCGLLANCGSWHGSCCHIPNGTRTISSPCEIA